MTCHSVSLPAVPRLAAVCLIFGWAAGIDPAAADISTPGAAGGEMIVGADELRTECYQHGKKIVDVGRLKALNVGTLLRDNVLTLKGGSDGASVVIVPLDETVCVVSAVQ